MPLAFHVDPLRNGDDQLPILQKKYH